jgi:stage V sporulation protein D (sporulation-specific penicillin-binding protein)
MDTALKMGHDTFYQYIYNFGFGKQLGIELNGESNGTVTFPKYVRDSDLVRIGFGQSIKATPLQLITACAAAINGGNLMKPYVVKAVTDKDGAAINEYWPEKIAQVIKPETSDTVRDILLGVVDKGVGQNGRIKGYEVGGNAGTAQVYAPDGEILQNKHISSFVGFAPADKPKYIVLVVVYDPNVEVDYGSVVAAPYAKMILEDTLKYGDVPQASAGDSDSLGTVVVPDLTGLAMEQASSDLHTLGLKYKVQGYSGGIAGQLPQPGAMVAKGSVVLIYLKKADDGGAESQVAMPNLTGMTAYEINDVLESLGLKLKATGVGGLAVSQSPAPGTTIYKGEIVEVNFSFPQTTAEAT